MNRRCYAFNWLFFWRHLHWPSESLYFQQVFFVESVCDDPEVIAANILVCTDVLNQAECLSTTSFVGGRTHNLLIFALSTLLCNARGSGQLAHLVWMCWMSLAGSESVQSGLPWETQGEGHGWLSQTNRVLQGDIPTFGSWRLRQVRSSRALFSDLVVLPP